MDKDTHPFDLLAPSFPVLVRTARSVLGWSQGELAKKAGVASQSISRIERFDRVGRMDTLRKIEAALNEAGIRFVQQGGDFGLMFGGEVAERLQSEIRQQQHADAPGTVRGPNRSRVYKRKIDLTDPPEVAAGEQSKRRIELGDEDE